MAVIPQDRLVRKEVALGAIREYEPPQDHIGLRQFAPFLNVESDDVIFQYTRGLVAGLAPARAEDAESELAQKDETIGQGRASIIDWALKDHYDPSDVSRYREFLAAAAALQSQGLQVGFTGQITEGFAARLARDDALRRRKLDNRLEWLIMQSVDRGQIAYNDGKIKFTVPWGRPGPQQDAAPAGGTWNLATSDPIGDIIAIQNNAYDTYGIRLTRALTSRKVLMALLNSDRWAARSGVVAAGTGVPIDPNYLINGWGMDAVRTIFERQTGVAITQYDSVYRTRPIGSNTVTNNKFVDDRSFILLPAQEDLAALDDNQIGFAKTLTSPHVEGNWTPGYYEWEKTLGPDPWGLDRGTGVKAFPVFPHMDLTYVLRVLP